MKKRDYSVSTGFLSLLAVLFIGLKLTGYIDWSWWWVLAPLWGQVAFVAVVLVGAFLVILVIEIFKGFQKERKRNKMRRQREIEYAEKMAKLGIADKKD